MGVDHPDVVVCTHRLFLPFHPRQSLFRFPLWRPLPRQVLRLGDLLGGQLFSDGVAVFRSIVFALRRRKAVPHVCFSIVPWHAPAFVVHVAEIELGIGITLFGS